MGLTKNKLLNIIKEETKKTISEYGPFSGHLGKYSKPTPEDPGITAVRNLKAMLNRIEPTGRKDLVQTLLSFGAGMEMVKQAFPLPDGTRLEDLMEPVPAPKAPMATTPGGAGTLQENLGPVNLESIIEHETNKIMDKLGDLKIGKMAEQLKTIKTMLKDGTLNNDSAAKAVEVQGVLMRAISRHLLEIANVLRDPPGATAKDPRFDPDIYR